MPIWDGQYAEKWSSLAYSPAELEQIASLPVEVRDSLYPSGIELGPASDEVGAFLVAYTTFRRTSREKFQTISDKLDLLPSYEKWNDFKKSTRTLVTTNQEWRELHSNPQDRYYEFYIRETLRPPEYAFLSEKFHWAAEKLSGGFKSYSEPGQVILLCWLLSARFLFCEEMIERSEFMVGTVNEIFAELHLPPLVMKP